MVSASPVTENAALVVSLVGGALGILATGAAAVWFLAQMSASVRQLAAEFREFREHFTERFDQLEARQGEMGATLARHDEAIATLKERPVPADVGSYDRRRS